MGACCTMPKTPRSTRSNSPEYGVILMEDNQNNATPLCTSVSEEIARTEAVDAIPQADLATVEAKNDIKNQEEPVNPEVDLLHEHKLASTKAALQGKLSKMQRTKLPKIYICLFGLEKDSEHERFAVEQFLYNKVNIFEEKSIEMVVINVDLQFTYPDGKYAIERLENFLLGEVDKSTICRIVFLNECLGRLVPPKSIVKWDFDSTLDITEKGQKDLKDYYEYDALSTIPTMVLKGSKIDLLPEDGIDEYIKAVKKSSARYASLVKIFMNIYPSELHQKYLETAIELMINTDSQFLYTNRTIMVNRKITNSSKLNKSAIKHYFPVTEQEPDLWKAVKVQIENLINKEQVFSIDVLFENLDNNDEYLEPLCLRLYDYLEKNLCGKPTECKLTIRSNIEDGVSDSLLEEIHCHAEYCQLLAAEETDISEELSQIQQYLTNDSKQWLILTKGTDYLLSNIIASAAAKCEQWHPDACCLFRFANLTTASSMPEGLFYFLFQQALLLLPHDGRKLRWKRSEHIKNFGLILECVTEKTPLVIFIDGITNMPLDGWKQIYTCLPEKLPPHVKLVVSGNEECVNEKKIGEVIRIKEKEIVASDTEEELKKIFSSSGLKDIIKLLHNEEACLIVKFKIHLLLKEIEDQFFKPAIKDFFACLTLAKVGLTDHEGILIFRRHYGKNALAVMDYICLMTTLRIVLRYTVQNGVRLFTWKHKLFKSAAKDRYLLGSDRDVYASLMRNSILKLNNMSVEKLNKNEKLLQTRCAQEGNGLEMLEKSNFDFLMNPQWLLFILERCGPFQIIHDINCAIMIQSTGELLKLREFFLLSASSLEYEGKQIFTQLHGRYRWEKSMKSTLPKMYAFIKSVRHPPIPSLLCTVKCMSDSFKGCKEYYIGKPTIDGIFRIPENSSHVVSLSSTRGEVIVWKVANFEKVRTMKGINNPKNFKMINEEKCLLLCGRELRVYNLNNGTLLTKLRELMNQKCAFFGLYDTEHAVTLSRSRMYVNMINIVTDKCDTTFKVGEDRFLNCLLVSGNGKICVCGDESKKPNSILVWNLETRKLIYDLKMPNHDFNTLLMAITYEGNYLCCVAAETDDTGANFVVVYDLQSGTIIKRWKPGLNTKSITISSKSHCVVVSFENSSNVALDLKSGTTRWAAHGHTAPVDVLKIDDSGKYLLSWDSTGKDGSVRLWEMTTGELLGAITLDQRITACELSNEGDRVFLGLDGESKILSFELSHNRKKFTEKTFGSSEHVGKVFDLGLAQVSN